MGLSWGLNMAARKTTTTTKKAIEQYDHTGKERLNNPEAGLVNTDTEKESGARKRYTYDPHLDPQLVWAGKSEHTSFEVPTISLHVHERIDSRTIIEAVRKRESGPVHDQVSLFETKEENPPYAKAIDFYGHKHHWTNRLIAGDSLLVMNSLLEKEGLAGQVQMIYIDPPYGIKYGSNFQPFVNKRDVKDGSDEDLTQEPETVKAFRDTWELGIHSYLAYLRDRLLLTRELLHESGSVFVQISDENVHHVREIMDEVFGAENFVDIINFRSRMPLSSDTIESVMDYVVWYSRSSTKLKYHNLWSPKNTSESTEFVFADVDGKGHRRLTIDEVANLIKILEKERIFKRSDLASSGYTPSCTFPIDFGGEIFQLASGKSWRTTPDGIIRVKSANRLFKLGKKLYYKLYYDDFPFGSLINTWMDTIESEGRIFVVQTTRKVIERCLLMTTDPGDLVFDPTCGSGTTAYVAEQWGRRWITCDTSRVAITLAKQRLMTALFDYYELAQPGEGVSSGFRYKTVPHITLKSIANNPEIKEGMTRTQIDAAIKKYAEQETLYDQPFADSSRVRVTGPFTVEAVPAPVVRPLQDPGIYSDTTPTDPPLQADTSISRKGETLRQDEWRGELQRCGVRGRQGQKIEFSRVEPLSGTRWLHVDAETKPQPKGVAERVAVSFGPEHAPLEQRQVERAVEEARTLFPRPTIILFAAFQFDPEAAKDIDELTPEKTGMTFLKVQMNTDLLTDDLKKKRAGNESFWLVGQPDVHIKRLKDKKIQVELHGFDYYNPKTGEIESGDTSRIAMWMLDTDYNGRSLFPRQVFFPMSDEKSGWSRLAKNLKAEIDEDLIEQYRGSISLPFAPGTSNRIAVKIVDDRGIESLKVMEVG